MSWILICQGPLSLHGWLSICVARDTCLATLPSLVIYAPDVLRRKLLNDCLDERNSAQLMAR